uniref:Uncharacterized protein n=1 Tax=Streptomyces sp. NBC_00119 TaxID=2975659 RepID=A0AAU1UPE6_9ACTN
MPLLFIEVDNCTEEAALIAAKFDKYARFFKRKEKDTDGIEKLVGTRLGGIRACAPAGPARLPPGRQALRQEPDGEGRRPHPRPLAGPVASRGRLPLLRRLHPGRGDHAGAAARARTGRARVPALRPQGATAAAGGDRQPPPGRRPRPQPPSRPGRATAPRGAGSRGAGSTAAGVR